MGLVGEFDIHCEALPLVGIARVVPEATIVLDLQYTHGDRPLFILTVRGGSQATLETALTDAHDVETWTMIERIEVLADGWRQSGWFADRETFIEFSTFWQHNAGFRLHRLTRAGQPESAGDGLSDRQLEALRTAYERGYFEVPRQTSLDTIAAELEISASSLSERLRRAQTHLFEETVATTWPPLPD